MFESFKKKFMLSKIARKLKTDLQEAEFSKNWQEKQKINLKLLWIDFLKRESEIMAQGFGFPNSSQFDREVRSGEDAYFPESFDTKDPLHDKFAEKIIQDYGGVMANSGKYAKCFYKPVSLLPYPKQYIKKACQLICKELNSEHPNWERPANADEMIKNIGAIEAFLPNFIEVSVSELPTDTSENLKVGSSYSSDN
ncbi:MAG: hypothetical protein ABIH87_03725 [bacterium]